MSSTAIRPGSTWRARSASPAARSPSARRPTPASRPTVRIASALFNERDARLGGEVGSDVNRDGNPSGSSGIFAVLWDAGAKNLVWVDRNAKRQLRGRGCDDRLQSAVRRQTTSASTTRRRRSPSADAFRRADGRQEQGGQHRHRGRSARLARRGIASGNALFGGAMSGAAPGANLMGRCVRACSSRAAPIMRCSKA